MPLRPRFFAPHAPGRRCATLVVAALLVSVGTTAQAQDRGFRLHRFEGTAAGTAQFLVERPWYSDERTFALGLTVDGSRNPLVPRLQTGRAGIAPIVAEALVGHLDLAVSLFDRVLLAASAPVTLLERGTAELVSQVGPVQAATLGDPRVSVMLRLGGHADRDPFSAHLGLDAWLPVGAEATHQGDVTWRLQPHAVLAGTVGGVGRWTVDAGFFYRRYASFGPPALGMTAAPEARVGLALGLALADGRLVLGPEAQFAMQMVGLNAYVKNGMSLEVLGGAHYLVADHLLLGVAGGTAFLGAAGTPDARAMVRLAWAPRHTPEVDEKPAEPTCPEGTPTGSDGRGANGCLGRSGPDADGDGVGDAPDRCPFEPETRNGIRDEDGCPEFQMERGSTIARVLAPKSNPPAVAPMKAVDAGVAAPAVALTKVLDAGVAAKPESVALDGGPAAMSGTAAGTGAVSTTGSPVTTGPTASTPGTVATPGPTPEASFAPDGGPAADAVPVPVDSDGDGITDDADRCPAHPEDLDDFEDEDGCPEPDNDQDGISDLVDQCPMAAETINGIKDDDGCPDVAEDADKDGVPDGVDRCPHEPEDLNGVRDEDGCPEYQAPAQAAIATVLAAMEHAPAPAAATPPRAEAPEPVAAAQADSDRDGVPDELDRCPVTPEDRDAFEDEDGCPEPDNDDDGVPDAKDKCPEAAETINGWQDEDGCPDEHPDVDADGVDYENDRCPLEPGNSSDGCPHAPPPALALEGFPNAPAPVKAADPVSATPETAAPVAGPPADFDRDGVPDEADQCPVTPEDRDAFEDEDGCPEPDNDRDGVPDAKDKCPFEAESINGAKDDDGCPDVGQGAVTVTSSAVVIDGIVLFKPASATLEPKSLPLLLQVAATLRAFNTLSVEIQGHTDDVGNAAGNIRLSKRRAETIRAVLVKAGVAPARLVAAGYGPTRPRAPNTTPAGREKNRRVEFLILGESK